MANDSDQSREAVAIDGPAGAGKSSVARRVAEAKGFLYVDTGAMYRAVALRAIRLGADLEDPEAVAAAARGGRIEFDASGARIFLDGEDVSRDIRSPEVAERVKFAARVPEVRRLMAERQRALAGERPVVMEGRDIATVVLPEARWKFFLTASPEARARRRHAETLAAGREADLQKIHDDIMRRDESDYQVGPMREARDRALRGDGIVYLDTSDMSPDQAVAAMLGFMDAGNAPSGS